jgi:3'-phosphoadenosine 5'-phosphosulfate sulfotransferase (PAPS reductase)/FAD synthetase
MKENLQVSFSGGETSAYMAQWIKKHWQDKYNIMFIFANTGNENDETLDFVERCDKHFGLGVNWVEAAVSDEKGVGTKHKVVNYKTASRNEKPFKDVISKYGIPNQAFPHCTRELKLQPMTSFSREYFNGEPYYSAIGIRSDEADRINETTKNTGFYIL